MSSISAIVWIQFIASQNDFLNTIQVTNRDMNDTNAIDFIECPTCLQSVQADFLIPAGATQVCANCRDEYLQRMKEGVPTTQSNEWAGIRQEHIKHEASLRSVGLLYYLGGGFMCIAGVGMILATFIGAPAGEGFALLAGMMIVYLLFGGGFIFVGRGLRQLRPWVKIPVTIFSGLGLFSIPIGTLINGYILYLMYSKKGTVVFSLEYQDIRAATPEIQYKTSKLAWGVLIILVLGFVALIASASMG